MLMNIFPIAVITSWYIHVITNNAQVYPKFTDLLTAEEDLNNCAMFFSYQESLDWLPV